LAMEGTKRSSRLARVIETPLWMNVAMSSGRAMDVCTATMLTGVGPAANRKAARFVRQAASRSRHAAGAMPTLFLNARLNAASDS
jgi:hypothetical protein